MKTIKENIRGIVNVKCSESRMPIKGTYEDDNFRVIYLTKFRKTMIYFRRINNTTIWKEMDKVRSSC